MKLTSELSSWDCWAFCGSRI